MIRLAILTLFLIILNLATVPEASEPAEAWEQEPDEFTSLVAPETDWSKYNTQEQYDLDADGNPETVYFKINGNEYGNWKTEVFLNNSKTPLIRVDDLLIKKSLQKISKSTRILKLELSAGGKLVNTVLYQYKDSKITEIPITTASQESDPNTWSSGGSEFKDLDTDGIKEMLIYHGYYPQPARTVGVYKFNGKHFIHSQEYDEPTPEAYY